MPGCYLRKLLSFGLAGCIVISSQLYASEARANQSSDAGTAGTIIVSRDVYYRSAIGPGFPGTAHRVTVAPDINVAGAIALGLKPLTDSETANMTAPFRAVGSSVGDAVHGATEALALSQGQRSFDPGRISDAGSTGGGLVGQAMGALSTALDGMRNALAAGQ